MQDETTRKLLEHAFTKSIALIWIVCTPLMFVGLLAVLFMRHYSLERNFVRGPKGEPVPDASETTSATADVEGAVGEDDSEVPSKEKADRPAEKAEDASRSVAASVHEKRASVSSS